MKAKEREYKRRPIPKDHVGFYLWPGYEHGLQSQLGEEKEDEK